MKKRLTSLGLFRLLNWIDGTPLLDHIEPYRRRIFSAVLDTFDADGRPKYNLVLSGRAKKNAKTLDLVLAALFCLVGDNNPRGAQCYILANDEDQAGDDLELAKKLIAANGLLQDEVAVKNKVIERLDGRGFLEILPAGDVAGTHGKTYRYVGYDEVHGYKDWSVFEALQPDPTRLDSLQWITSYASIYHRPGVPLFDLCEAGRAGKDARMLFSWYGADFTTDEDLKNATPERRANPSMDSWADSGYLAQQQARLPSHKYRRLHLNLPGSPEGAAYSAESVMDAVDRGGKEHEPLAGRSYVAFVDMSGGSNDDACLGIAHKEDDKVILDLVVNQGPPPPFDPRRAVEKFAPIIKSYGLLTATADAYAGETFKSDFEKHGIKIKLSEPTKSEIYESVEPLLNGHRVVLLDQPTLESQMLGLVWRGGKIDHSSGEHDDWSNAACGAIALAAGKQRESAAIVKVLSSARPLPEGIKRFLRQREDADGWERLFTRNEPALRDPRFG